MLPLERWLRGSGIRCVELFHYHRSDNRGGTDVKPSRFEERLTRKTRSVLCKVMLVRGLVVLLVTLSLIACSKNRSAATVIAKEHIDIAEAKPSPSPQPTPVETITTAEEMQPDEIEVEGYVMKKNVRGTSKDPRATTDEQWRITVDI